MTRTPGRGLDAGGQCCGVQHPTFRAFVQHVESAHMGWSIDPEAGQLVRHADQQRWEWHEVPELARSSRERNSLRLDVIEAWLALQPLNTR